MVSFFLGGGNKLVIFGRKSGSTLVLRAVRFMFIVMYIDIWLNGLTYTYIILVGDVSLEMSTWKTKNVMEGQRCDVCWE